MFIQLSIVYVVDIVSSDIVFTIVEVSTVIWYSMLLDSCCCVFSFFSWCTGIIGSVVVVFVVVVDSVFDGLFSSVVGVWCSVSCCHLLSLFSLCTGDGLVSVGGVSLMCTVGVVLLTVFLYLIYVDLNTVFVLVYSGFCCCLPLFLLWWIGVVVLYTFGFSFSSSPSGSFQISLFSPHISMLLWFLCSWSQFYCCCVSVV